MWRGASGIDREGEGEGEGGRERGEGGRGRKTEGEGGRRREMEGDGGKGKEAASQPDVIDLIRGEKNLERANDGVGYVVTTT